MFWERKEAPCPITHRWFNWGGLAPFPSIDGFAPARCPYSLEHLIESQNVE